MALADRIVAAALADLARGPVEGSPSGDPWIVENIIRPVWGPKGTTQNTQYCGDTVARWLRLAGAPDAAGMSSPGKIRNNWAKRVGATEHTRPETPRPGDIVLHVSTGWNGHVMLCLAFDADTGRVLVCEGNHTKSMGPSGAKYTPATYGEDQTRRQGIGMRWLRVSDPYIRCWVRCPSAWN